MIDKVRTVKEFRQLCKETGLQLPEVTKRAASEPSWQHIRALLTWAKDRGFIIHPLGYGYYVDGFIEFRHCPCDKKRPACPCDQAEEEVRTKGKCLCQLFWRDYATYIGEKLET